MTDALPPELPGAPGGDGPPPPLLPLPAVSPAEFAALPRALQQRYAVWLIRAGRLPEAEAALDTIARSGGGGAQLLEDRAAVALLRGDAAAARALWAERLGEAPAPSVEAGYARVLAELGAVDEAAAIGARLVRDHAGLATVRGLAARLATLSGDFDAARRMGEQALSGGQDQRFARIDLARIALLSGDAAGARAHLAPALADPDGLSAESLFAAAAAADLAGLSLQARTLRWRAAEAEVARAAALAASIDEALGREPGHSRGGLPPDVAEPARRSAAASPPPADVPVAPAGGAGAADHGDHDDEPAPISPAGEEAPADPRVLEALRRYWGFDGLRRGQAAVINRMLAGTDTLAIMPTGAGKSLTFQLPAMLLEGLTVVISPLIALMKDQVESLPEPVRERAALLNSTLSAEEQRDILDGIRAGRYRLVYVAPERLRSHSFIRALREAGVARVVVDEAHCISLWGHDFRPDYLAIPAMLPALGAPPVLAITATATREIERSIAARFGRDLDVLRTGVFRPNLRYEVEHVPTRDARVQRMADLCRELPGPGIVYVSSRKDAETFADLLRRNRVHAVPYHAGFDAETRARHQDQFMSGRARVVVATVAFGMGVDKADVRFIIHASPPGSLEAYAQESGRAGRDGQPSRCIMLAAPTDRAALGRLSRRDALDIDDLRRVYAGLQRGATGPWAILDPGSLISLRDGEDPDDAPDPRVALNLLEEGGLVHRRPDAPVSWTLQPAGGGEGSASPLWERLLAWTGFDARHGGGSIRTAEACAELGCTPEDLAAAIVDAAGWRGFEGPRMACVELLPAASTGRDSARNRLDAVLFDATRRSQRRIARVIEYQSGAECRHVVLARHLGERLEPCGAACDVCDPPEGAAAGPAPAQRQRASATAQDVATVLRAAASLQHPVGKSRLTLLLRGSPESRFTPGQNQWYGALADLRKARIEAVIDRLLEAGLLYIDPEDEYRVIRAADGAADAVPTGLDEHADATRASGRAAAASGSAPVPESPALDPEAQARYDRLAAWRRERAAADGLPPYAIASNRSLAEIAARQPSDLGALARIHGFGESRAAKYGAEMLRLLAQEA